MSTTEERAYCKKCKKMRSIRATKYGSANQNYSCYCLKCGSFLFLQVKLTKNPPF